ncbi:MAG: hypothetical protein WD670_10940, partial [Actinomycetota bacterium]
MSPLRRRVISLLVLCACAGTLLAAAAPGAQAHEGEEHPRQAFLFLIDGASYEEMMAVPELRQLARVGGAGLLSIRTAAEDEGSGAYLTIGAGSRSAGPEQVPAASATEAGIGVPIDQLAADNESRAIPGLLTGAAERAGLEVAFTMGDAGAPTPPGVLSAMSPDGSVTLSDGEAVDLSIYDADPARLAAA